MNDIKPKYIKTWEELSKEESPTHTLDIDIEGCNGWILPKSTSLDNWDGVFYLSTHSFYESGHNLYTKILQSCGFNVELANWDTID